MLNLLIGIVIGFVCYPIIKVLLAKLLKLVQGM